MAEEDTAWTPVWDAKPLAYGGRRTRPGSERRRSGSFRVAKVTAQETDLQAQATPTAMSKMPPDNAGVVTQREGGFVARLTDSRRHTLAPEPAHHARNVRPKSVTGAEEAFRHSSVVGVGEAVALFQDSASPGWPPPISVIADPRIQYGDHSSFQVPDSAYSAVAIRNGIPAVIDSSMMTPQSSRRPVNGHATVASSSSQSGPVVHVCYAGLSKTMPLRPSELNLRGVRSLFLAAFPNYVDASMLQEPFGAIYMQLPGHSDRVPVLNPRAIADQTVLELRELHPSTSNAGQHHQSTHQLSTSGTGQAAPSVASRMVPRSGSSASTPGDLHMGSYRPVSDAVTSSMTSSSRQAQQAARFPADPPWVKTPPGNSQGRPGRLTSAPQGHPQSAVASQPQSDRQPAPRAANPLAISQMAVAQQHGRQHSGEERSVGRQASQELQRTSSSDYPSRTQSMRSSGEPLDNGFHGQVPQGANDVFSASVTSNTGAATAAAGGGDSSTVRNLQQQVARLTAMVAVFQGAQKPEVPEQQPPASAQQQQHQALPQPPSVPQPSVPHHFSQASTGSQGSQTNPASNGPVTNSYSPPHSPSVEDLAPRLIRAHSSVRGVRRNLDDITTLHMKMVEEQKQWMAAIKSQVQLAVTAVLAARQMSEPQLPEEIVRRAESVHRRHELTSHSADYQSRCHVLAEEYRELFTMVEGMRADVAEHHCQVDPAELDAIDVALHDAHDKLAVLKGEVGNLSTELKPIMKAELEVIVKEEKFINHWSEDTLGEYVDDCQKLLHTVAALKQRSERALSPREPVVLSAGYEEAKECHHELMEHIHAVVPNHEIRAETTEFAQHVYRRRKLMAKEHKRKTFELSLETTRLHLQTTDNQIMADKRQRRAMYNIYMQEKEVPKPAVNHQPALLRRPTAQQQYLQQQRVLNSQTTAAPAPAPYGRSGSSNGWNPAQETGNIATHLNQLGGVRNQSFESVDSLGGSTSTLDDGYYSRKSTIRTNGGGHRHHYPPSDSSQQLSQTPDFSQAGRGPASDLGSSLSQSSRSTPLPMAPPTHYPPPNHPQRYPHHQQQPLLRQPQPPPQPPPPLQPQPPLQQQMLPPRQQSNNSQHFQQQQQQQHFSHQSSRPGRFQAPAEATQRAVAAATVQANRPVVAAGQPSQFQSMV